MDFLNLSEAEILKINKGKLQKVCFRHKEQYSTWFNHQEFHFEHLQKI